MRFKDLKIAQKLLIGFMLVAGLVLVAGLIGINALNQAGESIDEITEENAPLVDAAMEMKLALSESMIIMEEYKGATSVIASDDEGELEGLKSHYTESVSDFDKYADAILNGGDVEGDTIIATKNLDVRNTVQEADNTHNQRFQAAATNFIEVGRNLIEQKHERDKNMLEMENIFDEMVSDLENVESRSGDNFALADSLMEAKNSIANTRIVIEEYVQQNDDSELKTLDAEYASHIVVFDRFISEAKRVSGPLRSQVEEIDANHGEFQEASDDLIHEQKLLIDLKLQSDQVMKEFDIIGEETILLLDSVEDEAKNAMETAMIKAESTQRSSFILLIITIIAGVVLAIGIGLFITQTITKPMKRLEEVANDISKGDLTVKIENELLDSKDETGTLANSFNIMLDNLNKIISNISKNATATASTAEELSASSEQTNASSEQVSATVQEIAKGGQVLSTSASSSKQATDELMSSINSVAKSSQESAKNANEARDIASKGGESAKLAGDKMKSISEVVNSSSAQIQELGLKTQEINKIIEVINSISEQTNLLALNAAIEAARAGEAGKGFAVVADEVRKLAEESKNATKQIEDMVGDIVTSTKTSVEAMQKGTVEVEEGSAVVNQALDSLEAITSKIEGVANDIQKISALTQEQLASSAKVKNAITEVSSVAEESAASTEEVSASIQEISGSVQQVAISSQNLAKGAEELKGLIHQFKIE